MFLALVWVIATSQSIGAQAKETVPTTTETPEIQLFTAPDESSPVIDSVGRNQVLSPLAETIGAGGARWHLVGLKPTIRTSQRR
jgi:hypothetical protein